MTHNHSAILLNALIPIICFEGASAVGKTATANWFKEKRGAFVVPEVNLLFSRRGDESAEWYFERQAERWATAAEQSRTHEIVVCEPRCVSAVVVRLGV